MNEENAGDGRVVTPRQPERRGIIPAVLHYYDRFIVPRGIWAGNYKETSEGGLAVNVIAC